MPLDRVRLFGAARWSMVEARTGESRSLGGHEDGDSPGREADWQG